MRQVSREQRAPRGVGGVDLPPTRPVATWVATALACLLVLLALLAPDELSRLTPGGFVILTME